MVGVHEEAADAASARVQVLKKYCSSHNAGIIASIFAIQKTTVDICPAATTIVANATTVITDV